MMNTLAEARRQQFLKIAETLPSSTKDIAGALMDALTRNAQTTTTGFETKDGLDPRCLALARQFIPVAELSVQRGSVRPRPALPLRPENGSSVRTVCTGETLLMPDDQIDTAHMVMDSREYLLDRLRAWDRYAKTALKGRISAIETNDVGQGADYQRSDSTVSVPKYRRVAA